MAGKNLADILQPRAACKLMVGFKYDDWTQDPNDSMAWFLKVNIF